MGNIIPELGDLLFSLVIGYIGALELLYVVRHVYHWTCGHARINQNDDEVSSLQLMQDELKERLTEAEQREAAAGGAKLMVDGVAYKDGFRIEPQQPEIEELRRIARGERSRDARRQTLEAELAEQRRVEEETRAQLERAEAELARQRKETAETEAREQAEKLLAAEREREAEQKRIEEEEQQRENEERERLKRQIEEEEKENERLLEVERRREEEQRRREEEEEKENERRLLEAERLREEEQRRIEEEEENARRILEAERQRIEEEEKIENERRLIEAEKEREEEERQRAVEEEKIENEKRLLEAEKQREEEERQRAEENEKIENERKLLEAEKQREVEQRKIEEEERETEKRLLESKRQQDEQQQLLEEEARRLIETEKQLEEKHRIQEEDEENSKKLIDAEKQHEEEQRKKEEKSEDEENTKKLLAEKQFEESQRELENEEQEVIAVKNEQKLIAAEKRSEKQQNDADGGNMEEAEEEVEENERRIFDAERAREDEQRRIEEEQERADEEIVRRLLEAESQRLALEEAAKEAENCKQRMCEENARLFLEAEEKMVKLQHQMSESAIPRDFLDDLEMEPVVEEPCVKKHVERKFVPIEDNNEDDGNIDDNIEVEEPCERKTQTVKTQFGQKSSEPYSVSSKPLLFPSLSDEGSSIEPNSSQQSSFSTQPSEEGSTTVTDEPSSVKVQYQPNERHERDCEDNAPLTTQYSEEYLRSLDGLNRPLVREDGSGRRRAFKKRRSGSNSSNSSRESRTSREEEVKMFTSLEEDEMQKAEQDGNNEYTPIKYNSDTGLLKVKHGHHRRHKRRSPAKDAVLPNTSEQNSTNNGRGSLEMLGEESTDPWGEAVPEPYKNTEFWKQKKTVSIDEENADADDAVHTEATKTELNEKKKTNDDHQQHKDTATNIPKTSSFEEATPTQNEQAITAMKQRKLSKDAGDNESNIDGAVQQNETNTNLRASKSASPVRSSPSSLRLRRSPRIDAMPQYEESFNQSASVPNTPAIIVDSPSWREENNLMMEGISDFYDFTAAVNRSRNASRNASPANSAPNTPLPKDVNYKFDMEFEASSVDIYDDTGNIAENEFTPINVQNFIMNVMVKEDVSTNDKELKLQNISDDANRMAEDEKLTLAPAVCINTELACESIDAVTIFDEQQQMDALLQTLRAQQSRSCSRSRSRSPLPTPENVERSLETRRAKLIKQNDELFEKITSASPSPSPERRMEKDVKQDRVDNCSRESMNELVATLRAERSRSRSRSRSPLPSAEFNAPSISIEYAEGESDRMEVEEDCTSEQMTQLVESLRIARSRSRSKTPMRLLSSENDEGGEREQEVKEEVHIDMKTVERYDRARTPSRSMSQSPSRSNYTVIVEDDDFHELLNLEASNNRTLDKNTEEAESLLAAKQRRADIEALHALRNAHEEMELRTVTPLDVLELPSSTAAADIDARLRAEKEIDAEGDDKLGELSTSERLRRLRCSPTTPEYERSISEEWRDVQRIRAEQLASGFKRSTYVGESFDLGSEFEGLRREAAKFQRSRTPSPSISRVEPEGIVGGNDDGAVVDKRQLQAEILAELAAATGDTDVNVDGDVDLDELRREAVKFRRSRSNSRSPLNATDLQEIAQIEAEAAKRELQDKILDELASGAGNFQRFSRHLNVDFLESERRASDSMIFKRDDCPEDVIEPEEYHHFRRYSLAQEQPIEEYPEDDDYDDFGDFDLHSWASDDCEIDLNQDMNVSVEKDSFVNLELSEEGAVRERVEEEIVSDDDSEDERQTVVDVDDEIDEDFCDFVERGVTDESHHEQSECEEADRELDLYAGRGVNDWVEVHDVSELLLEAEITTEAKNGDEGADGGADPDSVTIDEIYDEAIRHRKQSGILRDYDSILRDMQNSYMDRNAGGSSNAGSESEGGPVMAQPKVHNVACEGGGRLSGRRAHEMRYLGDANSTARKSTRLRSRYGYVPQLQGATAATTTVDELGAVDVNYVPRREYNWRKNFRLDDDEQHQNDANNNKQTMAEHPEEAEENAEPLASDDFNYETMGVDLLDLRKYSLGGESITLFSRSRNSIEYEYTAIDEVDKASKNGELESIQATAASADVNNEEKPKKKKSKKKLRKESKLIKQESYECNRDDDDSECQIYSRRSSSLQLDSPIVDSPKTRKSRSRRSSKSSLTNDDSLGAYVESPLGDISEVFGESLLKKKTIKKRKKTTKDVTIKTPNEMCEEIVTTPTVVMPIEEESQSKLGPISTMISPDSASANALASLSPARSVCVTPTSDKSLRLDTSKSVPASPTTTTTALATTTNTKISTSSASAPATTINTPVDTFDILKDANFYPLF